MATARQAFGTSSFHVPLVVRVEVAGNVMVLLCIEEKDQMLEAEVLFNFRCEALRLVNPRWVGPLIISAGSAAVLAC